MRSVQITGLREGPALPIERWGLCSKACQVRHAALLACGGRVTAGLGERLSGASQILTAVLWAEVG